MTAFSISAAPVLTPVATAAAAPKPAAVDSSGQRDSTTATAATILRADTAQVIRHHFNHKQQIITGGAIMTCLVLVMTVMNNYNPQPPQP